MRRSPLDDHAASAAPLSGGSPLGQIAAGFGEIFKGFGRAANDSLIMSSFVAALLVLAGFGAFYLSWRAAAATLAVSIQLTYVFSGGVSGLALIAAGSGILYVQMSRHLAAREDREWERMLDKSLDLLAALKVAGPLRPRVPAEHDLARQR